MSEHTPFYVDGHAVKTLGQIFCVADNPEAAADIAEAVNNHDRLTREVEDQKAKQAACMREVAELRGLLERIVNAFHFDDADRCHLTMHDPKTFVRDVREALAKVTP